MAYATTQFESFTSYKQLEEKVKIYERSNFVQLGHRDSRTLEAARKKVPIGVDGANELKYHPLNLHVSLEIKSKRIKAQGKGFIRGNLALYFAR